MAAALARLGGTRRALLVSGCDGLDEVTLAGPTRVCEVRGDRITFREWTPEDFGLRRCSMEVLRVAAAADQRPADSGGAGGSGGTGDGCRAGQRGGGPDGVRASRDAVRGHGASAVGDQQRPRLEVLTELQTPP